MTGSRIVPSIVYSVGLEPLPLLDIITPLFSKYCLALDKVLWDMPKWPLICLSKQKKTGF
ncbi:MAG: hypothetical protein COY77_06050 [Candidatus Omnitrophica bacterium CG_4_10_14_0_8_um_filter_43_18]|nr:MAG: hypothetical protein COY77_06050 [Candidatus Omnitrophica bacterium CG_4_10_14_0_8_um_filter_43_18]